MTDSRDDATPHRPRLMAWIAVAAVAGAVVGLAAVYGIGGLRGNQDVAAACVPGLSAARRVAPLARGEVAAVSVLTRPRPVPDLRFDDEQGHGRSLADWRGQLVLLNLWATWCVPCRKEMPALDGLEAKLGGADFQVVAVNIDTRDPSKPRAFLQETGITHLAYFTDRSAKVFQDLKLAGWAFGMPTTLIVDPGGCTLAFLAGPAEWSSDDAVKLIRAALGGAQPGAAGSAR
jgi:thiol-disulfide isomerase/thioredoxin